MTLRDGGAKCVAAAGSAETLEITDIDMTAFLDPSRSLNEGALLAPTFKVGTWHWQVLYTPVPDGSIPTNRSAMHVQVLRDLSATHLRARHVRDRGHRR